ncbi:MAG TPA: M23 family metallopeptidase [Mycobacteriales bacterium]|nr:M23 family metallopeptidase [Mycobacteriales bacterium]
MPAPNHRPVRTRPAPASSPPTAVALTPLASTLLTALALTAVALTAVWVGAPAARAAPARPGSSPWPWRWPLPLAGPPGSPDPSGPAGPGDPGHAPRVTRGFDPPDGPYGPGHRGVDLAAPPGTPVLAAGTGVVGYAGVLAGRGVVTVVHANGLRTTYEPVHALVRRGQHVSAGTVLGTLEPGHAGCPDRACLHWGLLHGTTYLDPLSLFWRGPVRLLPLAGAPPGGATTATARRPGPDPGAPPVAGGTRSGSATGPAAPPWTNPGLAAALGLAVAGAVALSRRRPP